MAEGRPGVSAAGAPMQGPGAPVYVSTQFGFISVWASHAFMQPDSVTLASSAAVTGLLQQACSLSCSLTHYHSLIMFPQSSPGLGLAVLQATCLPPRGIDRSSGTVPKTYSNPVSSAVFSKRAARL